MAKLILLLQNHFHDLKSTSYQVLYNRVTLLSGDLGYR
jgi:hypothetical protein